MMIAALVELDCPLGAPGGGLPWGGVPPGPPDGGLPSGGLPLGGFPAAGVDWVVWVDVVALAGAVVEAVASVDKALGSLETMVAVAAVVEQALNARSAMIISEAKILQTFHFLLLIFTYLLVL